MLRRRPLPPGRPRENPMLFRVVRGCAGTALDLATRPDRPGLFDNRLLDRAIVFKQPMLPVESEAADPAAGPARPIETGVFVPDDPANPMGGGRTFYLDRRTLDADLAAVVGLRRADRSVRDVQDIRTLALLDDVPSLDPFLLRFRFEAAGRPLPDGVATVPADEAAAVRAAVDRRLSGVLHRAFSDGERGGGPVVDRLLDGLWHPGATVWSRVLAALGVHDADAHGRIPSAIRGVAFYEHQFLRAGTASAAVAGYLAEIADRPRDARQADPALVAEVASLRREVQRRFEEHDRQCRDLFRRADAAVGGIADRSDPAAARRRLAGLPDLYWTLGHYVPAILNCHAILDDGLATLAPVNVAATVATLLRRLRAPLLPRVPADLRL